MLTCTDAFANNTVPATVCLAQQFPNTDGLAPFELIDEGDFLLLILDSLQRLSAGAAEIPSIATATQCDVQQASVLAQCSMSNRVTPTERLTPMKLKALILWQLNEALCA